MQALKEREINFIDAMNRKERKNTSIHFKQIFLFTVPVLLFITTVGTILFLHTAALGLEKKIEKIQGELISEEIMEKKMDFVLLQNEISGLQGFQKNYKLLESMFEGQAEADKNMIYTIITQCFGKIIIEDLSMENSYLRIDCHCAEYKEAALYVQRLEKTKLFSKVNYQGFEKDGDQYIFSLTCAINNPAAS